MSLNKDVKKLDACNEDKEIYSSPLTEEQKKFIEHYENNDVFMQIYNDITRSSTGESSLTADACQRPPLKVIEADHVAIGSGSETDCPTSPESPRINSPSLMRASVSNLVKLKSSNILFETTSKKGKPKKEYFQQFSPDFQPFSPESTSKEETKSHIRCSSVPPIPYDRHNRKVRAYSLPPIKLIDQEKFAVFPMDSVPNPCATGPPLKVIETDPTEIGSGSETDCPTSPESPRVDSISLIRASFSNLVKVKSSNIVLETTSKKTKPKKEYFEQFSPDFQPFSPESTSKEPIKAHIRCSSLPPIPYERHNRKVRAYSLPPIKLNDQEQFTVSEIHSVPDPYATDAGSDTDWTPPKKRRRYRPLVVSPSYVRPSVSNLIENVNNLETNTSNPENLSSSEHTQSFSEESVITEKRKSRKRLRNVSKWKREIAKNKRLKGKKYTSSVSKTNKVIEKKELKPPCSEHCKLKCRSKIPDTIRTMLFNNYWKVMANWEQRRQFVASSIDLMSVKRPRHRINSDVSRRKKTRIYNLVVDGTRIHVCQKMFLNTLCITEQFVSTTLSKTSVTNVVEPDQRGKHEPANKTPESIKDVIRRHISLFPHYSSHYSRERTERKYLGPEWNIAKMYDAYLKQCSEEQVSEELIGKDWLYRKIFNEEFNLAFYAPSNDTCDLCDKYTVLLKQETDPNEMKNIEEMKKEHINDASNRYRLKRKDREDSKTSNGKTLTLMLDMQKCLPTPLMTNTQSFYLRKLWVLNETLHNDTSNKSYCMMWNETLGGRGANEVGSCLIEWALNHLEPSVTEITIWSDNCSGQNRNIIMVYCYFWLVMHTNLSVINHKFLLRGHTHSEVDMVHSVIERKKKEMPQFEIMVPRDWEQFVKVCKSKNPLIVHSMNLNNIRDIKSLKSHFSQKKKNTNKDPFLISHCVWFQVRKIENGVLFYKTSFNDDQFSQIDLRKTTRQQLNLPRMMPQCNDRQRPISNAKYKDLMTLTEWMVDSHVKKYYTDLSHGHVPDIVGSDDEN